MEKLTNELIINLANLNKKLISKIIVKLITKLLIVKIGVIYIRIRYKQFTQN
jgi:hypothetical protein